MAAEITLFLSGQLCNFIYAHVSEMLLPNHQSLTGTDANGFVKYKAAILRGRRGWLATDADIGHLACIEEGQLDLLQGQLSSQHMDLCTSGRHGKFTPRRIE